jgi:hypothetical protein
MKIARLSFDPFNLPAGMRLPKIPPVLMAGLAVSRFQVWVFVYLKNAFPGSFEFFFGRFTSEKPVAPVCCERNSVRIIRSCSL